MEQGPAMRHAVRSAALVANYFDTLSPPQAVLARATQQAVLAAAPDLAQVIKWGNLVFLHGGRHLLAIAAHKAHVNLQVFHGAELAERYAQLEGVGKGMRQLKLRQVQALDVALIGELVQASLALADAGSASPLLSPPLP
jgi:hypothetical protein